MRTLFLAFGVAAVAMVPAGAQNVIDDVVVVDVDAVTEWIEPLQDLPDNTDATGWAALGYDTSQDDGKGDPDNGSANWQTGQHGVGYGDGDDTTTIPDDNSTFSVYTRTEFTVDELARVVGMSWEVDFDDGYAALVNGVEIARGGLLGVAPIRWDLAALGHESSGMGMLDPAIDVSEFTSALVEGTNVLAIATFNSSGGSSDLTMIPRLTLAIDNTIFSVEPSGGLKEEGSAHVFQAELFLPEPPVTYQWTHNGNPVGTDSGTLTIPSLTMADSGTYVCTVTDASTKGIFVSSPATLTVVAPGSLPFGVESVLVLFALLCGLGVFALRVLRRA